MAHDPTVAFVDLHQCRRQLFSYSSFYGYRFQWEASIQCVLIAPLEHTFQPISHKPNIHSYPKLLPSKNGFEFLAALHHIYVYLAIDLTHEKNAPGFSNMIFSPSLILQLQAYLKIIFYFALFSSFHSSICRLRSGFVINSENMFLTSNLGKFSKRFSEWWPHR